MAIAGAVSEAFLNCLLPGPATLVRVTGFMRFLLHTDDYITSHLEQVLSYLLIFPMGWYYNSSNGPFDPSQINILHV